MMVYLTVCTRDRQPWLASSTIHDLLRKVWSDAGAWLVGRYTIMPDHLHLFAGLASEIPFDNWVKYWKSQFTRRHRRPDHSWQTDHWDTRMRTQEQYVEKLDYALQNPVRAGLVKKPEDWPYQGVIHDLPW